MGGPLLTEAEKAEIWSRRAEGESLSAIARHVGRSQEGVRRHVHRTGGVRPRPVKRPPHQLSKQDREEISRGLAAGASCRAIARQLGRVHSSVSREVARNGGRGAYRAERAELKAEERRRRPKESKLERSLLLQRLVEVGLTLHWSPAQISGWLKLMFPGQPEMQVSHETIYLSLFVQSRGALRKELSRYLRTQRQVRQARVKRPATAQIRDRIMISERPAEAADRAVPGHWEGDLLFGTATNAIGTLVERSTRYVMLFDIPGRGITAEAVRQRLATTIRRLPESLRRSLTWDQGKEMAEHRRFTVDTGVSVYFCDPRSPWQRGSNENTNGLLRDYYPKGKSLAKVTQAGLDETADQLNTRPRETLGWRRPADMMAALLLQAAEAGGAATH